MPINIVNEGGLPIVYIGSYKFKNKENRDIKLFNLREMAEAIGFEVEDFVVKKSKKGNNEMLFGAVVPQKKMQEIQKKMDKKIKKVKDEGTIIVPTNLGIVDSQGNPIRSKK